MSAMQKKIEEVHCLAIIDKGSEVLEYSPNTAVIITLIMLQINAKAQSEGYEYYQQYIILQKSLKIFGKRMDLTDTTFIQQDRIKTSPAVGSRSCNDLFSVIVTFTSFCPTNHSMINHICRLFRWNQITQDPCSSEPSY